MAKRKAPPKRLFKYRAFSNLTLEMLVEDQIFLADPLSFNDPLDTRPTVISDVSDDKLEAILGMMIRERVRAEMNAAAMAMRTRGPSTSEHIERQSLRQAEAALSDIRYNATNPEYEGDAKARLLCHSIEQELLRRYDRGVFALGERATCPLMWSHYGDQHRGVCIGYSVPNDYPVQVWPVKYGGSRVVQASLVGAMLADEPGAKQRVDQAVLLLKAQPWRYEKEWRFVGPKGLQDSDLELEEVSFGIRCAPSVKYAVVRALEGRSREVRFYEIRETAGRFPLVKRALDFAELAVSYPRNNLDQWRRLDDLDDG